jgi:hypothetical protein
MLTDITEKGFEAHITHHLCFVKNGNIKLLLKKR